MDSYIYIAIKSQFKRLGAKTPVARAHLSRWEECRAELQAAIKAPVPDTTHHFFSLFGCYSMDAIVISPANSKPFLLDITLGYCRTSRDFDVLQTWRRVRDRLPARALPFGRDPMGNFWLLKHAGTVSFFDLRKNEDMPLFPSLEEFIKALSPLS